MSKRIVVWFRYQWNLWNFSAEKHRIERRYASHRAQGMRDGKPQDEFTKLNQQKETELNYVDEKIAVSEFSYLAHLAPRLRVPTRIILSQIPGTFHHILASVV
jgi:hypothetical protein